jgi:hypothetical protein
MLSLPAVVVTITGESRDIQERRYEKEKEEEKTEGEGTLRSKDTRRGTF